MCEKKEGIKLYLVPAPPQREGNWILESVPAVWVLLPLSAKGGCVSVCWISGEGVKNLRLGFGERF